MAVSRRTKTDKLIIDDSELLYRWQELNFKESELQNNDLRAKVDFERTRLGHLNYAQLIEPEKSSSLNNFILNCQTNYITVLDSIEPGLNNYAEDVLKLAENKKLENMHWKSGLNLDTITTQDYVQKFIDDVSISPTNEDPVLERWENKVEERSKNTQRLLPVKGISMNNSNKKRVLDLDEPIHSDVSRNEEKNNLLSFCTAKEQLAVEHQKKNKQYNANPSTSSTSRKCLGARRTVNNKFIPPLRNNEQTGQNINSRSNMEENVSENSEYLKNIDARMIEMIENEIMDHGTPVTWDDIAGLDFAKTTIKEVIVWPMLRPDLFTGLRAAPKGILLFGPPGTGKTMIGKCIASQSQAVFFSISASSLTSKWIGEGEKMVRALFAVARNHQPSVIFIDEIDSLLTHRSDNEHESSRRIKTEFLVQLDGAGTSIDDRILVVGATNRPQELDEAARRRLVKRLFVPLPDLAARSQIILHLLNNHQHNVTSEEATDIGHKTEGYSGADVTNLCREAALGPIRSIDLNAISSVRVDEVRPINYQDFTNALRHVKASVSCKDMKEYVDWNDKYGSGC